jgi:diguanylate cyclase (GGDEF)-like protein
MLTTTVSATLTRDELHRALGQVLVASVFESGDLLLVKDLKSGTWLHVNPPMASFLRGTPAALTGGLDSDHFDAGLVTAFRAAEQTAQAQGEPLRSEHAVELHGQRREFSVLRVLIRDSAASRALLVSVWRDLAPERKRQAQLQDALAQIEQQQQANELLRREIADQALRDPASGLYRRAHFDDQLRREVDLSTREHREFAIVFIQLDPESSQALALGAAGQQRVLQAMGQLLRGGTRAMDASCRYDERRFAVLLSGVGLATAHARMEGLRRKCAAQIVVHEGQELRFAVSIGVASFPHTAQGQDELLASCEAALAEAQRRGGNQVTLAAIRFSAEPAPRA